MWRGTLPLFRVDDEDGLERGTQLLWQRREMVVALLHGEGCERCVALERLLRRREAEWSADEAGLVFVHFTPEQSSPARALLAALAPFGIEESQATMAIADRFGRLFAALDAHAQAPDELMAEAHDWVAYVQSRCEECGAPLDWGPG